MFDTHPLLRQESRKKKRKARKERTEVMAGPIYSTQLCAGQRLSPPCSWLAPRTDVGIAPILCLICCLSVFVIPTTLAPCSLGGMRCSKAYRQRKWPTDHLLFATSGRTLNKEENWVLNWTRESAWVHLRRGPQGSYFCWIRHRCWRSSASPCLLLSGLSSHRVPQGSPVNFRWSLKLSASSFWGRGLITTWRRCK